MSGNKKDSGKLILIFIASISVIVLVYCVVRLTLHTLSTKDSRDEIKDLKEKTEQSLTPISVPDEKGGLVPEDSDSKDPEILSKYKPLYDDNPDFAGWIKIDGTKIDYPVMQTVDDEEFYLHRNFEKESSDEGLPFIDARCDILRPSSNLIIYGHNMKNGDIFADLLKFTDKEFFLAHDTIEFDSLYRSGTYKIISVFRVDVSGEDPDAFKFYQFVNDSESYPLSRYLSEIKEQSIYEIPFDPEEIDELITLVTCEYTKKDGRLVMISAKVADK